MAVPADDGRNYREIPTMKCPTTSGSFRCLFEAGHVDDFGNATPCEAQAPEYATTRRATAMPAVVPKEGKGESK